MTHRDPSLRLSLITDTSDVVLSGIMTRLPHDILPKPHEDQRHSLLPFLFSHLSGSRLRWSTLKKDAYAIMKTVDGMH